jgi:hypothetical protein
VGYRTRFYIKLEMSHPPRSLARPVRKEPTGAFFFEKEPDWRAEWWGMPEFTMGDATPRYRITINLLSLEDVQELGRRLGLKLTARSDTAWFPPQRLDEPKEWCYVED